MPLENKIAVNSNGRPTERNPKRSIAIGTEGFVGDAEAITLAQLYRQKFLTFQTRGQSISFLSS